MSIWLPRETPLKRADWCSFMDDSSDSYSLEMVISATFITTIHSPSKVFILFFFMLRIFRFDTVLPLLEHFAR